MGDKTCYHGPLEVVTCLFDCLPDVSVLVFTDWIDVLAHGPLKQVWRLRDDSHRRAQVAEPYLGDVHTVNEDCSLCGLEYTEECE